MEEPAAEGDALMASMRAALDELEAGQAAQHQDHEQQLAKHRQGSKLERGVVGDVREEPSHASSRQTRARPLSDLELGVKASFTTRQWRERAMHRKALHGMRSTVAESVRAHQGHLRRQQEIVSQGANNKAKAAEIQLDKVRRENLLLAQRLERVQKQHTELSPAGDLDKRPHIKALRERRRYLSGARRAAQAKLDAENALILRRIAGAAPCVEPRARMKQDYREYKVVRSNMCRLAVRPESLRARPQVRRKLGGALSPTAASQDAQRQGTSAPLPPLDAEPETLLP